MATDICFCDVRGGGRAAACGVQVRVWLCQLVEPAWAAAALRPWWLWPACGKACDSCLGQRPAAGGASVWAACSVDLWLQRHNSTLVPYPSQVRMEAPSLPSPPLPPPRAPLSSAGALGAVRRRSAGPHLQLEGGGDIEEAADSRLEAERCRRARAVQGERLKDGREQQEELCTGQAFAEAHTLT